MPILRPKMFAFIRPLAICLVFPLTCLLTTGCGSNRLATARVAGVVTWNGKPVEAGTITFYPEKGRPASGRIQPDGSYTLTTFNAGDGAILGAHRVTIEATAVTSAEPSPKSSDEEVRQVLSGTSHRGKPAVRWLAPKKYSSLETTPLTAEVKPGPNTINFDLLDKP